MQDVQEYNIFGRQIAYVIAVNFGILVLGIIQLPILTKALGVSQYGAWSLITTVVSLITPFVSLSFNSSIIRFLAAEKDASKIKEDFLSACLIVLVSGVIFSSIFFFSSHFIAAFILKDAGLTPFLRLSSVLILLNSIFPVLLSFFRRESKFGVFNLLSFSWTALQVTLTILFILLGYRLEEVIEADILSTATLTIITTYIILKQIGFSRPKFTNMKTYLKWGLPLTPTPGIQWIIDSSDSYIINYFLGISATGIYNAAFAIGGYASFALLPVQIVLYPIISKAHNEGNLDKCRDYLKYSFKYLMMFTIPACIGLSLLAKPLLRIITAPEFISGYVVVALAAFGALAFCLFGISMFVIYLVGKTQIIMRLLGITALVNIIINVILVPRVGIIGAGVSSLIAYVILGGLGMIVALKYLKFDLSLVFLIKCILSSVLMAFCIWLINPQSMLMVFISIIGGIITYFGGLILVKGFSKTEVSFFASFFRNSFTRIFGVKN